MTSANEDASGWSLRHLLAGIEAGVTGTVAMLLLSMAGSAVSRRTIWTLPNLLATTFYGDGAYRFGFQHSTWAGLALLFVVYALLGGVWGLAIRDDSRARMLFLGAAFGVAVYYLLFQYLWKSVNPLVPLYAQDGNLRAGHLLWGLCLARAPRYARYIREAMAETTVAGPAEINVGEVIL